MIKPEQKPNPTIQDLYPELTPEEQIEAAANLKTYLAVVYRIFERMELEKNGGGHQEH